MDGYSQKPPPAHVQRAHPGRPKPKLSASVQTMQDPGPYDYDVDGTPIVTLLPLKPGQKESTVVPPKYHRGNGL